MSERWQPIDVNEDPDVPRFAGDPAELVEAAALIRALAYRPAWQRHAACLGEGTSRWFPSRGESTEPARAVCAGCPVADECHAYALEQETWLSGVWAGTSERQRRRMRRASPLGDIAA